MKREIESSPPISGMERSDYEGGQTMMGSSSRDRIWREKKLEEASLNGSVESLKQLMQEDPLTLARASITCFNETPLHIAAMLGHLDFAQLLLHHKSDFTSELDLQGRAPLHLASANGYVEIVKILVLKNVDACFIRDENGRTPLHLAVMKGRIHVIKELLMGTNTGFLNIKDKDGNTVLHIAAALKRTEIIKYLLSEAGMEVNAVNENGFTALDIIEHTPRDLICMEIRESLLNAGALRAKNEVSQTIAASEFVAQMQDVPRRAPSRSNSIKVQLKHHEDWLSKKRESLMVAATVVAAMAYQAGLNPPGGVWNEDRDKNFQIVKNSTDLVYDAGTSIMAAKFPGEYVGFWVCNTICFVASLSTIFLLVSGVPLKRRIFMWILMMTMWVTLTFMALTYLVSVWAISPGHDEFPTISTVIGLVLIIWLGLIGVVFLAHTVRFIIWVVRKVRKCMKKRLSTPADRV